MKLRPFHQTALALSLVALGACDTKTESTTHTTSASAPADNTKINGRDQPGAAGNPVTPMDQGNDPADLAVTQRIRKALLTDESLSVDAKNVKVITANGVVTLRGPVKSASERAKIEGMTRELAPGDRVDDQIDVESSR